MDIVPINPILEVKSDTIKYLRGQYGLEKSERIDEAIDIFLDWLKKQNHLIKKDYSREYVERIIIFSKGSVERAKLRHDKICTFRTLMPTFFEDFNMTNNTLLKKIHFGFFPKLTNDHYRVYILKNIGHSFEEGFTDAYKYLTRMWEYLQSHDYCNGVIGIVDFCESNLFEVIKSLNVVEMRHCMSVLMEGYAMRVKGIHIVTNSRAVDTLIGLFKQALSSKIAQRIHNHRSPETLCEHIERDVLPSDYGGNGKSIKTISDELKETIRSQEVTEYFNTMRQARTDEAFRSEEKFNDQYIGAAGSFRKLVVD